MYVLCPIANAVLVLSPWLWYTVVKRTGGTLVPQEQDWYRLDNAGVLYAALKKEKYAPVYRFEVPPKS